MALSHPEIRFKLSHDGRVVFQTSGNGKIQEILYQMYGREVAENAVYFEGKMMILRFMVMPFNLRSTVLLSILCILR